ncbi:MAG: hypothetical protein ACI4VH_05715 [Clostridia bacterium]
MDIVGELIGKTNIGGVLGAKWGYGTHYVENCYSLEDFNLAGNVTTTNGVLEVTNSQTYSLDYMKSNIF